MLPLQAQTPVTTYKNSMTAITLTPAGDLHITASATSSADDFDFLTGRWYIHNRKLKSRLTNSREWTKFEATGNLRKLLQGRGNIDDFVTAFDGKPFEGMTLRLFDPHTRLWSIYWSDSNRGTLDKPVLGSFDGNRGTFYCQDVWEGKAVTVMFRWDKTDPAKPIWSQAFSADGGKTWEWNWYMYFSREGRQEIPFPVPGVLELRNYLMKPDATGRFIQYFSDYFVGTQQAIGVSIPGIFTVEGEDDRFFWMRGFDSMEARSKFLRNFYEGDVWKGYGKDANAMMIDSDQVHLLRPLASTLKDATLGDSRYKFVVIDYYQAREKQQDALLRVLEEEYLPAVQKFRVPPSVWVTEMQENDFPRLPVIQQKDLVVVISSFANEEDYKAKLKQTEPAVSTIESRMLSHTIKKETVMLQRVVSR
jgi:hypothetical protein